MVHYKSHPLIYTNKTPLVHQKETRDKRLLIICTNHSNALIFLSLHTTNIRASGATSHTLSLLFLLLKFQLYNVSLTELDINLFLVLLKDQTNNLVFERMKWCYVLYTMSKMNSTLYKTHFNWQTKSQAPIPSLAQSLAQKFRKKVVVACYYIGPSACTTCTLRSQFVPRDPIFFCWTLFYKTHITFFRNVQVTNNLKHLKLDYKSFNLIYNSQHNSLIHQELCPFEVGAYVTLGVLSR